VTVQLGVTLPQFTSDPQRLLEGAQAAEELGLDSVWAFDHLWPLSGGKTRPIFESWTTLAYIAARTKGIRVGTLVTRSTLRNPALLAKIVATVAETASGRVVLALGSGDELSREENQAFGIDYFGSNERLPQMISSLEVVRAFFDRERVFHSSAYTSIADLPPSPRPTPPPALWVGGRSVEVRRMAGEICDGWNSWGSSPERFEKEAATVLKAAAGRSVELSWGGQVIVADTDERAEELLGDRPREAFVVGSPESVARRLRAFVAAGANHLICAFPLAGPESYSLLAGPVRELLA
jgi:alkanesulfonate monooxygenase SsuD/methylene tetrahydromethanopterin reductase-like flavin-dependent oxidoreductase (luciferase family)